MSHHHQGHLVGAAAAIVGCDFLALLADINLGAIATGISLIGGSTVGVMYLWITQRAEAKAKAHKLWLEAHSNEIELEQARLKRSLEEATVARELLSSQVAELKARLDEKDRTLVEYQGENNLYRMENEELIRQRMIHDGYILKTETTTKVLAPPSSDAIPIIEPNNHPPPPGTKP